MLHRLSILLLLLVLSGCVSHSSPSTGKPRFQPISNSMLTGTYNNLGDPIGTLSSAFWMDSVVSGFNNRVLEHAEIELVQLEGMPDGIRASAIKGSCVAAQIILKQGKDYTVDEYNIVLTTTGAALSRGAGDALVGPSIEQTSLSFDTNNNAVVHQSGIAAGLAYMLVPIAHSHENYMLYKKVGSSVPYEQCEDEQGLKFWLK